MRRVLVLAVSAVLAGACSPAASKNVSGTVEEWKITISPATALAGEVTFTIKNNGEKEHEFVVRKTALAADKLNLGADGEVIEDDPSLEEIGELAEIKPGTTGNTVTLTLAPGHYVIFCNLHVGELLH